MSVMGFGNDRIRVVRVIPSKKCWGTFDRVGYLFDSHFEYKWAKYLQFLKEHKEIKGWEHHPCTWDFRIFEIYLNRPFIYTPDFRIYENDGTVTYQECKGYIETKDISRIRRAAKHYDAVFDLVMQRVPKKGKRSQIIAKVSDYAFVRRVIDASKIFRQMKGIL